MDQGARLAPQDGGRFPVCRLHNYRDYSETARAKALTCLCLARAAGVNLRLTSQASAA